MCSLRGNQEHIPINGVLPAGMMLDLYYDGPGSIWNNDLPDDGALYNFSGQLVSYWVDPG